MLSFFPEPYPDELLYSILARYHRESGNIFMADTLWELFEQRRAPVSTILPTRLGLLSEKTKTFGLDFERLLVKTTMYPFYMVNKREQSYKKVYEWAKENKMGAVACEMGVFDYLPRKKQLCFCPKCYQEEMDKYGESYWHRLHQTPGVLICEKHSCRLQSSNLSAFSGELKGYYPLSENCITLIEFLPELDEYKQKFALEMVQDIQFLYQEYENIHKQFIAHEYSFAMEYLIQLSKQGLATPKGFLRKEKLRDAFETYFTKEYLEQIGEPVIGSEKPWIVAMCRTGNYTKDILKCVLMAQFLYGNFRHFITNIKKQSKNKEVVIHERKPVADLEKKKEVYRERFTNLYDKCINPTRTEIRKMDEAAYLWLIRQDKDWLESHFGAEEKRGGSKMFSDWKAKDLEYAKQIPLAVKKILNRKGRPIRITIASISKELQVGDLFYTRKQEFPLSMKVLIREIESKHDWYQRKIKWAEKELIQKGEMPAKWKVLHMAAIRNKTMEYERYMEGIVETEKEKNGT